MSRKIVISSATELVSVASECIAFVSSDGNYSTMTLIDRSEQTFSFNLQHFGQLLSEQLKDDAAMFIRIGKSLIINREYIFRINPAKQQIILVTPMMREKFSLSASKNALRQVKQLLESETCMNTEEDYTRQNELDVLDGREMPAKSESHESVYDSLFTLNKKEPLSQKAIS